MDEIVRTGSNFRTYLKNKPVVVGPNNEGKLPPQVLELEESVLGAIMLDKEAINTVIEILSADSFYKEAHILIYKAMTNLYTKSEPIDLLTVTQELRENGTLELVGGAYFITQLTTRLTSAANVEFHSRIIQEKYIQRQLIKISKETIRNAYEDTTDVFELLDKTERGMFELTNGLMNKQNRSIADLLVQSIKELEKMKDSPHDLTGVPTGFAELDRMTSGFQKSNLIIIAARPGMGKTAFVLSLARNMGVDYKRGVAIFSLEMSSIELVNRLLSIESQIPGQVIRDGKLDKSQWEQLMSKITRLNQAPIYIDDTPQLSVFELRAKARRLKQQYNISILVIDYLQLMRSDQSNNKNGTREQEISYISRSLKALAKELEIPVIALSQLSRDVEKRTNSKKPVLSDLRESGSIEQDADMVMFLYRPEYYQLQQFDDGTPTEGMAEIIIQKHRNGALGDIRTRFIKEYALFTDSGLHGYVEGTFSSGANYNLPPDNSKKDGGTITFSSKINDMDDDAPF
jgi:replicative DNA helicase